MSEIFLAGGCFWGLEQYLSFVSGVLDTEVGYANGLTPNPSYERICRGDTGYAETVRVVYDNNRIPLLALLGLYFLAIDPLSTDGQGRDRGRQYRAGIYYLEEKDRSVIQHSLKKLQDQIGRAPIIEVQPLLCYYRAEEYHQKYLEKNPAGYCHLNQSALRRAQTAKTNSLPTKEELKKNLTQEQYRVTQEGATEPPFHNEFWDFHQPGLYVDVTTGAPLFLSSDKFDSGCGWPCFSKPVSGDAITKRPDTSLGLLRTEVRSRAGGAHLGHVFQDGPTELGGIRYCVNSAALRFVPKAHMEEAGYGHLLYLISEE